MELDNEALVRKFEAEENWDKAEEVCHNALKKEPDSHWWLLFLGYVQLEKKEYSSVQDTLDKSDKIQKHCPLAAWLRGCLHYDLEEWGVALEIFRKLHNRCTRKLNSDDVIDDCWESIQKTESIDNDCRGKIGFCYYHLDENKKAVQWLKKHLQNRKKGQYSVYPARIVRRYIKEAENA